MFSVGYNFEEDFLRKVKGFVNGIKSIYFPIPVRFLGSGRTINQPPHYEEHIKSIIGFCEEFRVKSLILLNPTCEGDSFGDVEHIRKILEYLQSLQGLSGVVAVNPLYMKFIKKKLPFLEVQTSVNCYIKNVEHAKYFDFCDVITVDRDINWEFDLLKDINKKTGKKIKVLVNEGCLSNCPYRNIHYNMLSHGFGRDVDHSMEKAEFFSENACTSIYREKPWMFFKIPFVRPEDVKLFNFVDEFKLSTRIFDTDTIVKILEAYIDESFDGNLVEILDTHGMKKVVKSVDNKSIPDGYYKKVGSDRYCRELFGKVGEVNPS